MKIRLKLLVAITLVAISHAPRSAIADSVDEQDIVVGSRYTIESLALGESREILVSAPKDRSRSYPVIFVLNADAEFLLTVAAVRHLALNANKMPDFIVVGVVPVDGAKETRPSFPRDGSKNEHEKLFRQFVAKELVTHIDATYDTHPYRILVGHSLSGLFTLNTLRSDADNFNAYFAFSPALWWDDGTEANAILQSIVTKKMAARKLVITVANEGAESLEMHRDFVAGLERASSATFALMDAEFPEETHSSTTLPALNWSLQQLFVGWRPGPEVYQQGLTGLEKHYRELSEKFGWQIQIPLAELSSLVFEFARRGSEGDDLRVIQLIEHAIEREPGMVEEFVAMIGALEIQGHADGAAVAKQALCGADMSILICAN